MDPIAFLVDHAPFSELAAEGRAELARSLEITWARRGERLIERPVDGAADGDQRGDRRNDHLFIVRRGAVRLELDGQRVDELGPGEVFGLGAVTQKGARFDAVAATDCLLYRLPGTAVRALLAREPAFATFFLEELSERLRALASSSPVGLADLNVPVGELVTRRPVMISIDATAGDAALLMEQQGVSSVLLDASFDAGAPPAGIVTDRDLRARVLARGRGPATPLREIMSAPLRTVEASVSSAEAVLELLRLGIHHLAVERDGEVVGMLAHSDLQRHRRTSPAALLRTVEKARSAADLGTYAEDVTGMVEALYRGGVSAIDIGRLVAALGDALGSRLIALAEAELGAPPCDYAWIVFGSEGRREQSLLTDQDNALIYAEPAHGSYFAALAERVVADLIEVGFPPCAGGFMATRWHRPLAEWHQLFERWIEQPEPEVLIEAANFFDFRVLHGSLQLEALESVIRRGAGKRFFLAHMARAAFEMRPPLGMLHRIRESQQGVDLKAGAIIPITSLARLFALEAGDRRGSTLQRLETARRAGTLSEAGAGWLSEAFRFVFDLRLDAQLSCRRAGLEPGHFVHLDTLSPVQRRHLKEAFVAIERLQSATAERLGTSRLG